MKFLAGNSVAIQQVRAALESAGDANVLVTGAPGTGKEAVARALHAGRGPFVRVDCAAGEAVPEASGGVLFLDEIDALPAEAQASLARALTETRARVIASSTSSAAALGERLDADLYRCVAAVHVALPPLSARLEDIPQIVEAWLEEVPAGARPTGLSRACAAYLASARLERNLRQLEELLARAVPRAAGRPIEVADLALTAGERAALAVPERELLLEALARNDWNLARTSRSLDIALNTLKSRLKKHGLPRRRPD